MVCPECSWQNATEQKFCAKCGLFLLEPQTHWYLSSNGRRLGAFLLESLLSILTLYIGYAIWLLIVANKGKTPGKQILGLTIINEQGRPIGFWHHLILRELLGKALLGILTFGIYTLLDSLWLLWDRHHQCLHDKIAGTYVVRNQAIIKS